MFWFMWKKFVGKGHGSLLKLSRRGSMAQDLGENNRDVAPRARLRTGIRTRVWLDAFSNAIVTACVL